MSRFWQKNTREELLAIRTQNIFYALTGDKDVEPTELEMVQTINNVRRMLVEHLEEKKALLIEQSVSSTQKAKEITHALEYVV